MGRKTFDSIGKGLSGRRNLVVSRNPEFRPIGATRVPSLAAALDAAGPGCDVFIVGGAEIYRQALPLADRVYLTVVHAAPEGDAHFFLPEGPEWSLVRSEAHGADAKNDFPTEFRLYERNRRPRTED
jgi:dihydrofolate reductase